MTAGPREYVRDGAEIYRRSFAVIRAESDLSGLPADVAQVAVRMVHACGQVDLPADIGYSPGVVTAARSALRAGAPILCDAHMVASGITLARLPAGNDVVCTLRDPRVPGLAAELGTTRSAAALELWRDRLDGAVVAIGNAPTALFHLLDMIDDGAPRPAAVIGIPVGFIGAAESKLALAEYGGLDSRGPDGSLTSGDRNCGGTVSGGLEHLVVHGRRGGSAITAAAVNALASERE